MPPAFRRSEASRVIPAPLAFAENGLRIVVFILPFFMPLDVAAPNAILGLLLFAAGTLLYFASWLPLILFPDSVWSRSPVGFAAPAYTPLLWLFGIALLGDHLFWGSFYRWWMYLVLSLAFLVAHVSHTTLVHARHTADGANWRLAPID